MKWALLFAFVLAARLTHSGILWVEEAYPAAAAIQLLHGKALYRDVFFDKPPLSPFVYLLWGARDGVVLRIAGALFVLLCSWLAARFSRALWSPNEAWIAAALTAFFLTFGWPAAVMALSPDLLMLAPHLAAVHLAWSRRPFAAGALAGVALLLHTKGLFVLAACLFFAPSLKLVAGFAAVSALQLAILAATGSLEGYWQQVWVWGARYAADTFVANPFAEAVRRTAGWTFFHAAAAVPAFVYLWRTRKLRMLAWLALSLAAVAGGWRFFPRYYFQLLPVAVIAASRGFTMLPRRHAYAAAALLLIPAARFGPRFIQGEAGWNDTAMNRDSREAARLVASHPGRLLVWGYRPDVFVHTRRPAATPWLDSQPLTGVLADRHLGSSAATFPGLARSNLAALSRMRPDVVVDGLGPFNPALAAEKWVDWLGEYEVSARTPGSVIYVRNRRARNVIESEGGSNAESQRWFER